MSVLKWRVCLVQAHTHTHVYINTHIHTHTHKHMDKNINHLSHSHCMREILNVVFRSTSGECGKPFDVKVMVQIHFFSASFFSPYLDSATHGWYGGGCHICQGFPIRYIRAHVVSQLMFYGLTSLSQTWLFSYKLCDQPAELCGVLQTSPRLPSFRASLHF